MAPTSHTFNGGTAARILGIPYWTLYSWDRSNLFRPSRRVGEREGTRRHYTFLDLVAIRTIVRLKEQNVPTQRIRKALRVLKASKDDLARLGTQLVAVGDDVKLISDEQTLVSLVTTPMQTEARSIVQVDVAAEAAALRSKIEQIEQDAENRRSKRKRVA